MAKAEKKKNGCLKVVAVFCGSIIVLGFIGGILSAISPSSSSDTPEVTNERTVTTDNIDSEPKSETADTVNVASESKIKTTSAGHSPKKSENKLVEPEWDGMFLDLQKEIRNRNNFVAPSLGSKVKIEMKAKGIFKTGNLKEITYDAVVLQAGTAVKAFPSSELSMDTRARFFEDDYIDKAALNELNLEKKKFQAKKDKQQAELQYKKDVIDAQEQLAAALARKKEFDKAFNGWDDSHRELVKYIKQSMNDPDSFKHVSTTRSNNSAGYIVHMVYSGKNGFGGRVKAQVTARLTSTGQLAEILSME